ncbi:amino acid ABC transporter permease [Chitinasiproducens palmae]|uniref:Amino acid ABC transporter membrane protein 1, PAAT family n=1 Tax=Chitinasiproducens palmae TaxID=1770053 RepID=A0A1H2PLR7_9BURK|nr:amino acid ABC transporter permease [Chitinasiproducens palmae]SDV47360.1 amino acid ABC transporter membrane protein 1, PAAT family [Chitinasiproducens palmae]
MTAWLEPRYMQLLWQGLYTTLLLTLASGVAATLLGVALALLRYLGAAPLRGLAQSYILAFRNTPLLIQLLFWYFGAASLLPPTWVAWLNVPRTLHFGSVAWEAPAFEAVAAWVGLSLYTAAFVAEECRAGLRGVPGTQAQAGAALGLTRLQCFRYIVLPQAVKVATPALFGQYMNLVKNSSLAMAVGLAELSYQTRAVESETFRTFQTYGVATLMYVGVIVLLEVAMQFVRRGQRLSPGAARGRQAR